jgi:nucleotide-binding universal stress UspA family protein
MEYTLPDEYLEETELERQRKIHDSLITMGLKLISESYLEGMAKRCEAEQLEFEPRMMDGKHHTELIRDISSSDYDLVVLGALGIGRVRDSQIGSVCERVTRTIHRDIWVVKHLPGGEADTRDTILVGIDGSPQSFGALLTGIDLAKRFDKKIELISVYDPYLHYSCSTASWACSLKGGEGLPLRRAEPAPRRDHRHRPGAIYQSHLEVAERMAKDEGVDVTKTLLDAMLSRRWLDHVRKTNPWLLVVGRIGVHSPGGRAGPGSNSRTCCAPALATSC